MVVGGGCVNLFAKFSISVNYYYKTCHTVHGGGIAHLHLQASRAGPCSSCTGSWRYLGKKESWTNAHKYWTGGKGKPECFIEGKEISSRINYFTISM